MGQSMATTHITHLERIALDAEVVEALDALAGFEGVSRQDLMVRILRDWLKAINALPNHDLEDGEPTEVSRPRPQDG